MAETLPDRPIFLDVGTRGRIYACYSRYCDWIKVGFTTRPERRFRELNRNYPAFAPFTPIGMTWGTIEAERQIHYVLEPFRRRGRIGSYELYPATHSVVVAVKMIVANECFWRLGDEALSETRAWAERLARHPLNRVIIRECFDRERAA